MAEATDMNRGQKSEVRRRKDRGTTHLVGKPKITPSTSLRWSGSRMGYLGESEVPAYILSRTSLGRVSWLRGEHCLHFMSRQSVGYLVPAPALDGSWKEGNGQAARILGKESRSHEVRPDLRPSRLNAFDDGFGEGGDVAVGGVEGDSDDGFGPGGERGRASGSESASWRGEWGGGTYILKMAVGV
jgi:hypothetical protein